jgi:hypothetical protein
MHQKREQAPKCESNEEEMKKNSVRNLNVVTDLLPVPKLIRENIPQHLRSTAGRLINLRCTFVGLMFIFHE